MVAQREKTSAVWGTPARVVQAGIVAAMLSLSGIPGDLMQRVTQRSQITRNLPAINDVLQHREALYEMY